MTNKQIDLTGDPIVEEQIRQYYIKKKYKEELLKVSFTEGIATEPRERVEFTIDNSYMQHVTEEDKQLLERGNSMAWRNYNKAERLRKKYEEEQTEDYAS